jgi:hypothetical protein
MAISDFAKVSPVPQNTLRHLAENQFGLADANVSKLERIPSRVTFQSEPIRSDTLICFEPIDEFRYADINWCRRLIAKI